jgi:hypothetical protein
MRDSNVDKCLVAPGWFLSVKLGAGFGEFIAFGLGDIKDWDVRKATEVFWPTLLGWITIDDGSYDPDFLLGSSGVPTKS